MTYSGKIEHHWAKHHLRAIALLAAKDRIELEQYTKISITNNALYSP